LLWTRYLQRKTILSTSDMTWSRANSRTNSTPVSILSIAPAEATMMLPIISSRCRHSVLSGSCRRPPGDLTTDSPGRWKRHRAMMTSPHIDRFKMLISSREHRQPTSIDQDCHAIDISTSAGCQPQYCARHVFQCAGTANLDSCHAKAGRLPNMPLGHFTLEGTCQQICSRCAMEVGP
jgi:hypothetical protein